MANIFDFRNVSIGNKFRQIHRNSDTIGRSLFQNALSANPKLDVAMPTPSSEIMFSNRAVQIYVHIYA